MFASFIPVTDGVLAVVGIETADMTRMVTEGWQPGVLDFRQLFERGWPLPSAMQILYCRDEEHYMSMMRELFPNYTIEPEHDSRG